MLYEYTYMLRNDLSTNQIEDIKTKVNDVITKYDGEIVGQESWGLRHLAYKVKKNKKSHYFLAKIKCSSEGVKELSRIMSNNENVLRTLSIAVDAFEEEPSIMVKLANSDGGSGRYDRKFTPRTEFTPRTDRRTFEPRENTTASTTTAVAPTVEETN